MNMFDGYELSEITKYLCYQDFINFHKVSKSIYERTKNEYILRRCIATLSINKIKKCWYNYSIPEYRSDYKWINRNSDTYKNTNFFILKKLPKTILEMMMYNDLDRWVCEK